MIYIRQSNGIGYYIQSFQGVANGSTTVKSPAPASSRSCIYANYCVRSGGPESPFHTKLWSGNRIYADWCIDLSGLNYMQFQGAILYIH